MRDDLLCAAEHSFTRQEVGCATSWAGHNLIKRFSFDPTTVTNRHDVIGSKLKVTYPSPVVGRGDDAIEWIEIFAGSHSIARANLRELAPSQIVLVQAPCRVGHDANPVNDGRERQGR